MFVGTVRYTIIRSTISLIAMVTSILIYRLFGPTEIGKIILIMGLIQGVAPLVSLGTSYSLIRFAVNAPRAIIIMLYRRTAIAALIGVVLLLSFFATPLSQYLPLEVREIDRLIILLIVSYCLLFINRGMLRGLGRLNTTSVMDGVVELVPRLLIFLWFFQGSATYQLYLTFQLGAVFIVSLSTTFFIFRIIKVKIDSSSEASSQYVGMNGYWKFIIQSLFGYLMWLMTINISLWIVRYLGTPYDVGLMGVAMRIPMIGVNLLLTPLLTPLVFYFTSKNYTSIHRGEIAQKGTIYITTVAGIVVLILVGSAPFVVPLFFGAEYIDAIPAYRIFANFMFIAALQVFFNPIVIALNRQHLNNITLLGGIVVQIIGIIFVWSKWGITGVSLVVVLSYLFFSFFVFGFLVRKELPGLMPLALKLLAIYIPFIFIAYTSFWLLGGVCYLLVLFGLKFLNWQEIQDQIIQFIQINIFSIFKKESTYEV